jgi:hypothetical protein
MLIKTGLYYDARSEKHQILRMVTYLWLEWPNVQQGSVPEA